tara:strand:+ start:7 stop:288 length:282 start_codon:yes stop_codon:yes gene_type:complete
MIIEIALFLTSLLFCTSAYSNFVQLKRQEALEGMLEEVIDDLEKTIEDFNVIDSTGAFQASDEVGSVFEGLKEALKKITKHTEKELVDGTKTN